MDALRVDTAATATPRTDETPARAVARRALILILAALDEAEEWPGLGHEAGADYLEVRVPGLPEIDVFAGPEVVTVRVAG